MAATHITRRLFRGSTSNIVRFRIEDSTQTSPTGLGKTAIAFNAAGMKAYYVADGVAAAAITLVAGTQGTWSSGGWAEVDATNMPGVYELGVPDAVIALAVKAVVIEVQGATGASPAFVTIELISQNDQAGRLPY